MYLPKILVALLCTVVSVSADRIPYFHNSGTHASADPYTFFDSKTGRYYAFSTEGADEGSLFAIYSSPDLATWHKYPGGVLRACYDDDSNRIEGGQACWARDWQWAPEIYFNEQTGWYFFFFAGRLLENLTASYFRYSEFEEPSKLGVAVSRSPTGPFHEIEPKPIDYYPFDPDYHDVNLIMDDKQMLPPQTLEKGETAPKGTFIPTIDPNIFFDTDGRIYLYTSRNAYRNWNWDSTLGKYIEESNIIVIELSRDWWDDPTASTMPQIVPSQINIHANETELPSNITSYNGTGTIGTPPRKDGWKTVISYAADPQSWENYHVNDYVKYNGTRKDRRWSEGSTTITRRSQNGTAIYLLTYSANNYEASNYGVGFATAASPFGPFRKSSNNPILSQDPDAEIPIYSTGHGSIVASGSPGVGTQEVTFRTPKGAELFYVHHGRNSTSSDRSLYTTRLTLDESAVYFRSDDALSMHLTSGDQPLPKGSYPIRMTARNIAKGCNRQFEVSVLSKLGAAFDLREVSNRVVGFPGPREAESVTDGKRNGSFILEFGTSVTRLAYQRLLVNGTWSTIVTKRV